MPISKKNNLHIGLPSRWTDFLLHLNRYIRVCIMNLCFWKILIVACNTNHTWQREENHTRTFCSEKYCLKNNPVTSKWNDFLLTCIPVGCVPPACWLYRGGVCPTPGGSASRRVSPYPGGLSNPRGVCPTWGSTSKGSLPNPGRSASRGVGQTPLPLWTEWHTGLKTLPCPKLRLRAVIRWFRQIGQNQKCMKYNWSSSLTVWCNDYNNWKVIMISWD